MRRLLSLAVICLLFFTIPLPIRAAVGRSAFLDAKLFDEFSPYETPETNLYDQLYRFQGPPDGVDPKGSLIGDRSGALYGTSIAGGYEHPGVCALGCGTVFKLTPNGNRYAENIVYRFHGSRDGWRPQGNLVLSKDGSLYGQTCCRGGPNGSGYGTIFKLSPNGSRYRYHTLYYFKGGTDGNGPEGLIADGTGALYGTTELGGSSNCQFGCGMVFKLTPKENGYVESILYRFQGGPDGFGPLAGLIADRSGSLYGTTAAGGGAAACPTGCGTVFRLTPSRSGYTESILYAFQGKNDGISPEAPVIRDESGALYGTTYLGGGTICFSGEGCGTVFRLSVGGSGYSEQIVYRFFLSSESDGVTPVAGLVRDGSGRFYGTTIGGGLPNGHGYGTVFELVRTRSGYIEKIIHSFELGTDGGIPYAPLYLAENGELYGTTGEGGGYGLRGSGTVFRLAP